jgi:hypothetical protein
MHDGECFDRHPLIQFLQSRLTASFPMAQFSLIYLTRLELACHRSFGSSAS